MKTCDQELWIKLLLATLKGGRLGSAEDLGHFVDSLMIEINEREKIGKAAAESVAPEARWDSGRYTGPLHCCPHSPSTIREALSAHPDWKYDERNGRFHDGGIHDCSAFWHNAEQGSKLCPMCALNECVNPIKSTPEGQRPV